MLDLTRREFLGSLLALPAVALIPNSFIAAAERIIVPDHRLLLNKPGLLDYVNFWYGPASGMESRDLIARLEVVRLPEQTPLISVNINARAYYVWRAKPGQEIVVTQDRPMLVYMERIPGHVGHIWTNLGGDDIPQMEPAIYA